MKCVCERTREKERAREKYRERETERERERKGKLFCTLTVTRCVIRVVWVAVIEKKLHLCM